jgi:CBS domain-containing protein
MPPNIVIIKALIVVTAEIMVGDALVFHKEYNIPAIPAKTDDETKAIVL